MAILPVQSIYCLKGFLIRNELVIIEVSSQRVYFFFGGGGGDGKNWKNNNMHNVFKRSCLPQLLLVWGPLNTTITLKINTEGRVSQFFLFLIRSILMTFFHISSCWKWEKVQLQVSLLLNTVKIFKKCHTLSPEILLATTMPNLSLIC